MPSFANPFAGNVDRKMTNEELMQALRLDIAGELEAIYLYESHYLATDDPVAKAVLSDIRDEEKAHMGELVTLMRYLDPKETELFPGRRGRGHGGTGSSWASRPAAALRRPLPSPPLPPPSATCPNRRDRKTKGVHSWITSHVNRPICRSSCGTA